MAGDAKRALRSKLRGKIRLEIMESGMSFKKEPGSAEAPRPSPPRPSRAVSVRRRAREDDSLLAEWAEEEIPRPDTEEEETAQFKLAAEESRLSLRRRQEEEEAGGREGYGGSVGSNAVPQPATPQEPPSRRRPREEEEEEIDRSAKSAGIRPEILRTRERTRGINDPEINRLWERFDRALRFRDDAFGQDDFRDAALSQQDMNDFALRVERREEELRDEEMNRRYPPAKGKGKSSGKSSKGKSSSDKRARYGSGVSGW
jgi:hypothetical protein